MKDLPTTWITDILTYIAVQKDVLPHGIAILFILCEGRTQLVYKSIWKEVVKLAPGLQHNLCHIMCDYEKAWMNAVHEQFPNASLRGYWFHYCQAVLKKWKQLELLTAPYKVVSMAMTLALAPPEMFSEGLNLMQMIVDEEYANYPNVLLFLKYMRSTWLPISEKISVYGCPIRTNNLVESFHNILLQKIHMVHPNFWVFLDNISKIIVDLEINYDRLVNGLEITKARSQFNKRKNEKIQKAQMYLFTGIYSLKEFLQLFEKENIHKQHKIALLIDDNNVMEVSDLYKEGSADSECYESREKSNDELKAEKSLNVLQTFYLNQLNDEIHKKYTRKLADKLSTSTFYYSHFIVTTFSISIPKHHKNVFISVSSKSHTVS